MNVLRTVLIASAATLVAACSSAPTKPVASALPAAPANASVAGNWTLSVNTPAGTMNLKMSIVQNSQVINAKITDDKGTYDYDGTVNGNDVKFGHDSKNMPGMRIEYIGTVAADAMSGKAVFGSYGEGAFTGKRL